MLRGAASVRLGTRFLDAAEADVHPEYLKRLVGASPEDTVLTEVFSVMWPDALHRVLRSCVEKATVYPNEVVGEIVTRDIHMPIPRYSVICPSRSTTGEIGAMALYAGESVGAVRGEQPAAEIVREVAEGAEALLRTWR